MSTYALHIVLLLVLLLVCAIPAKAQDIPPSVCTTLEQCRILVVVVRAQLLNAQDAWAFWVERATKLQEQIEKAAKPTDVQRGEEKKHE